VLTHDDQVLSNLQTWLAGPAQACRLLVPIRSSVATPGLLATLRAIARVVRWNLAALWGIAPPGFWPLPGLEDAAVSMAPARVGWDIQRREPGSPSRSGPEPVFTAQQGLVPGLEESAALSSATVRAGWDIQRTARDSASRQSAESAAGTQPGRTPGQTPRRTRIPQQVEDSGFLVDQVEKAGGPDLSRDSTRVVVSGPGLGRDLALKAAIRAQLDAVLASTGIFSGWPATARRGVASSPFWPTVAWSPEVERHLGRQAVRGWGELSFAPLAGGDVALLHGGAVGSPELASDHPQQVGESRVALSLVGDVPPGVASGEVGSRKRAAVDVVAPGRRFSVHKGPAGAEAAKGAEASESVQAQAPREWRRMEVQLARAPAAASPAPETERLARVPAPPTSARLEPGHKPREGTDRPPRAALVQDSAAAALVLQAQATLAHVDAGLLAAVPVPWSAEPSWEMGGQREQVLQGMAPVPPAARRTIREIEHRLASIGGQSAIQAVRQDQREALLPFLTGERHGRAGSPSEQALVEVVVQLSELVGQLQRQVQQLAAATGQSLGGAACPGQEPEGEADPKALSRKLAEQLVKEARRYGIRI
jgi:hypothetical protein